MTKDETLDKMAENARELGLDYEPDQVPIGYLCENAVGHKYFRWKKPSSVYKPIPLYTIPPQRTWIGLTENEANELWESTDSDWELMKRTEAKLRSKNENR